VASVLDRTGLQTLIASLASLDVSNVEWDPDPSAAMVSPESATRVTLTLFGLSALGVDEHRVAFSPGGYPANSMVTTEIGNRDIIVNIMVEAYDLAIEAAEVMDRIRTGIRADASTATLNGLNLALVWMTRTTRVRMTAEQRAVSVATADLKLAGIAQLVSSVQVGAGWIDQIDSTPVAAAIIPGTFVQ
jgi:hypothetical protein